MEFEVPDQPSLRQRCPACPGGFIHFVKAGECELGFAGFVDLLIQFQADSPKSHFAPPALLKGNETWFNQINKILIPLLHLNQTPFADNIILHDCAAGVYATGRGSSMFCAHFFPAPVVL